ncbi:aromatic-ring-hydroxylating dioxygenase subunit beta [Tepidiphilus sp. HLB4]
MDNILINQISAFLWQEADMLDHSEYDSWLNLWTSDGLYIVPIDPGEKDFSNTLNYAYDNAEMRSKRVARLLSGESVSTTPPPRTIRSVSRFRILAEDGGIVTVRCAQDLHEFRRDVQKHYISDVTFELVHNSTSFLIRRKIIRLLNSTDALQCIGFIL